MGTLLIGNIELINFWLELEMEKTYLEITGDRIDRFDVITYAPKRRKMPLYLGVRSWGQNLGAEGAQKKKRTFLWSDMVSSAYSEAGMLTGVTPAMQNQIGPCKTPLELLNRYKNRREVVGTCDANDTMSRWSDQLLLTPENHRFEGSNT